MVKRVQIIEVAPRDGFQILPRHIPLKEKLAFIQSLVDAGCDDIEASSFVDPRWVPQLADSEAVCKHFLPQKKAVMTYLVPNLKGARRAIDAGATHIFLTTSASVKHCRDNLNQTIDEVMEGAAQVAALTKERGVGYTASIAAAFGYSPDPEGVPAERVSWMAENFCRLGFSSVTICDTSGEAHPDLVYERCNAVMKAVGPTLGIHLHQSGGIEFANAYAALQAGIRKFESAAGGMGGCPYVKRAKGNIATETLVKLLHAMGYQTGVDIDLMEQCGQEGKRIQSEYGTPECGGEVGNG